MAFNIVIGKSAQCDIRDALDWYAGESISALERFWNGLQNCFEDLSKRPETFDVVRQSPNYRKVKLHKFPYYIVFRVGEPRSKILIVAVVHIKRDPAVWVRNLR